ncbi:MAG: SDR family NAD(P)-dependent oxidoreductase [Coriobacteriales bacterium]|jgi:NAD(P)-dependent dehydrogenase (short-subunit alcohol dehydrogenase family)
MEDILDLSGRVALITGASSRGIGSGAAKKLAAHGAKVFLLARREEQLEEQAAEIEKAGGEADYAVCDVSKEEECANAVKACVDKFGRLDIMVLAAGISGDYTDEAEDYDFDVDDWNNVLGINLFGQYYMYKYGWEHIAKNGVGSIIQISSMAALKVSGGLPYTASKGALLRMVPWLARRLGRHGIRVNAICPGLIDTDMTNPPGWDTTEMLHKPAAEKAPLRRCATIDDCANAILFLASDAARCITGVHVPVDGGEALIP